jgi:hypothetical protein
LSAAWPRLPSDIDSPETGREYRCLSSLRSTFHASCRPPATVLCLVSASPPWSTTKPTAPPKVPGTVPKATETCLDAMVEALGVAIPREESAVRHTAPRSTNAHNPLYTLATIR